LPLGESAGSVDKAFATTALIGDIVAEVDDEGDDDGSDHHHGD
jgi:hypothetical protein